MRGIESLDRRVRKLEGPTNFPGVVCILVRDGDDPEALCAEWEARNGPFGARVPVLVNLVDSKI
ncbi:hypothetical protein [Tsuneonella sp. SYSU-LHT278]|uniref:hypothetical protein n=1 Tax=Tsuneonella sediminis TaxID=3416089 RepID=UPI003F7ABAD2